MQDKKLFQYLQVLSTATSIVAKRHIEIVNDRFDNNLYRFDIYEDDDDGYSFINSKQNDIWTDLGVAAKLVECREFDLLLSNFIALQLDFVNLVSEAYDKYYEPANPEGEQLLQDLRTDIRNVYMSAKVLSSFDNNW